MPNGYEDLYVWQRAIELALSVYRLTALFPRDERFELTPQMRRAAVSIPSNIAEGWGRNSPKDLKNFLAISRGSVFELRTQLTIATRLSYADDSSRSETRALSDEVSRMLVAFMKTLP